MTQQLRPSQSIKDEHHPAISTASSQSIYDLIRATEEEDAEHDENDDDQQQIPTSTLDMTTHTHYHGTQSQYNNNNHKGEINNDDSDDDSQDFFKESSFDVSSDGLTMSHALNMLLNNERLPCEQAFPLIDQLLIEFHKLKIFLLRDFVLLLSCEASTAEQHRRYQQARDRIMTCKFVFAQDENHVFSRFNLSEEDQRGRSIVDQTLIVNRCKQESIDLLFFELNQLLLVRPVITALKFKQHASRKTVLSFGDSKLDRLLGGGLRTRCITELWGESGSGKTQLCMQLLSMTVTPQSVLGGMGCRAVYIHSEPFPVDRLSIMCDERFNQIEQIKEAQRAKLGENEEISSDLDMIDAQSDLMSRIFTVSVSAITDFMETIDKKLMEHCARCEDSTPIKLIIVDSITALFRTENAMTRSAQLGDVVNKLRRISERFNLCILIVNQVSDHFSNDTSLLPSMNDHTSTQNNSEQIIRSQMAYEAVLYSDPNLIEGDDEQDEVLRRYRRQFYLSNVGGRVRKKPALGLAWTCYVNMSLMCSRNERASNITFKTESPHKRRRISTGEDVSMLDDQFESQEVVVRQLHVVFAPHLKNGAQSFIIEQSGVRGIDIT